jgi:transcriptional regulator with XRE-family HTH domain
MGLGGRIKTIRQNLGLTLTQLSKKSKVSKAYLSQLENEQFSNPTTEILIKLCNGLGVSLNTILGFGDFTIGYTDSLNIPSYLRTLAKEDHLRDADLAMLANISYNGKQPNSVNGWRKVLSAIQQSIEEET